MKEYYMLQELAELLHLNIQTLRKFVKQGQLKASKIGRNYVIKAKDLEAFVDSKRIN